MNACEECNWLLITGYIERLDKANLLAYPLVKYNLTFGMDHQLPLKNWSKKKKTERLKSFISI